MNELGIIAGFVLVTIIIAVGVALYISHEDKEVTKEKVYYGPVPEGYDEAYFRKTGITKPLGDVING